MPVVGDYILIQGDAVTKFTKFEEWNTGGRHAPGTAYVSLMIRGLQAKEPRVLVNGTFVGRLLPNDGQWVTESVHFGGEVLRNGDNTLEIKDLTSGDEVEFKSIMCHFKQDV
jgi:hypothetical protein